MKTKLPNDLTPLNLKSYLFNALRACGCSEQEEMVGELIKLLEWHADRDKPSYKELYGGRIGVFYLLAGQLDELHLAEHGTSGRWPWLTESGQKLLAALEQYDADTIEAAEGEAYDGIWW